MPLVNYCRKCRTETPLGESCPYCGGRLPKTGEQLSFGIIRTPVTDWFSWNDVLRVALPAWLVALGAVLMAEASATGAAVRLADGMVIETGRETALPVGAAVLVAVRPEGMRVSATGGADTIAAEITAVMPIGPALIYEVALIDGSSVKVVQERAADAPLAGPAFLHLKPNRITGLFPDHSGDTHKKGN